MKNGHVVHITALAALLSAAVSTDAAPESAITVRPQSISEVRQYSSLSVESDTSGELRALNSAREAQKAKPNAARPDSVSSDQSSRPDARFPATAMGRALEQHMLILLDIGEGADERKSRSLRELRRNPKEASSALFGAYRAADSKDYFARWLLSLTLSELRSNEAYTGLRDIAYSPVPSDLKDSDLEGNELSNESAIRQSAVAGLVNLARAGNSEADKDLLRLAIDPPYKDDAVRTMAIKGYLSAGRDYEARVQVVKTKLPKDYHDVVTLAVSQTEEGPLPSETRAQKE